MIGWFEDHLSVDAVVAYVDGELALTAHQRAAAHLATCMSCAADVAEQRAAQQWLRTASTPAMPGSLADILRSIPVSLPVQSSAPPSEIPGPPPMTVVREGARRTRLGASALFAGLAASAVLAAVTPGHAAPTPLPSGTDRILPGDAGTGAALLIRTARLTSDR